MKKLPFFLLLFFVKFSFAQNNGSFANMVSQATCNCLEQKPDLNDESFKSCLLEAIEKNEGVISKELWNRYKDTSYEASKKLGRIVMDSLSVTMIYTCKAYFKVMDTLRYQGIFGINGDSLIHAIKILEDKNTTNRGRDFYFSRGFIYFMANNFETALRDFDKALYFKQKQSETLVFKAWTLELMKEYNKAIAIYDDLALSTGNSVFKVWSAICKRKQKSN